MINSEFQGSPLGYIHLSWYSLSNCSAAPSPPFCTGFTQILAQNLARLHNSTELISNWRLLKSNSVYLYAERVEKLNASFMILTNNSKSVREKFQLLGNEPNQIKGLNVGFMTLMFEEMS